MDLSTENNNTAPKILNGHSSTLSTFYKKCPMFSTVRFGCIIVISNRILVYE